MALEHATSPLPDGSDVVVYPPGTGFGFVLPAQHTITVNRETRTVYLSVPDHRSGFVLERIEDAPGELGVYRRPAGRWRACNRHRPRTGGVHKLGASPLESIRSSPLANTSQPQHLVRGLRL